jgi:hypothetical protein
MESLYSSLDKGYAQERMSHAERYRNDPLIRFKVFVIQQLFNLINQGLLNKSHPLQCS